MYQGEGKRGGIHQPHYGTWVADFILRQDAGRFMLGRYLSDKKSYGSEGDDSGWQWQDSGKYANSQVSDKNRQDAISRVSAVQNSVRGPRWKH